MGLRESFLGGVLVDLGQKDSKDFTNTAVEKIKLIFPFFVCHDNWHNRCNYFNYFSLF